MVARMLFSIYLFQETGLLGTKAVDTPLEHNPHLWSKFAKEVDDKSKYK